MGGYQRRIDGVVTPAARPIELISHILSGVSLRFDFKRTISHARFGSALRHSCDSASTSSASRTNCSAEVNAFHEPYVYADRQHSGQGAFMALMSMLSVGPDGRRAVRSELTP